MDAVHAYLRNVNHDQIMVGAEPFFFEEGEPACLLFHGWGGNCDSMRPLGRLLARAGITVFGPLLPGHGTSLEDMARTDARDWMHAAERHLRDLAARQKRTFVVGLSMGGLISLALGALYGGQVAGVVSINAPIALRNPEMAAFALREDGPEMLPDWEMKLMKDPQAHEVTYAGHPRNSLMSLLGLQKATEELLPHLSVPTLVLQSREDATIPPENGSLVFDRIGAVDKRLGWLTNSYHVATLDFDKERIADEIVAFVRSHGS